MRRAKGVTAGKVRPVWRVAWLFLAIAVWVVGGVVPLPGVDAEAAALAVGGVVEVGASLRFFGVMPLATAYVLVELGATLVPAWRPLRASQAGRRRLRLVVLGGALVITAAQGMWLVQVFREVGAVGAGWYVPMLSLLAMTALLWWVLGLADERGAGSSLAVVLGLAPLGGAATSGPVWRELFAEGGAGASAFVLPGTLALVLVVATLLVLRMPVREEPGSSGGESMTMRIPPSGIAPLFLWGAIVTSLPVSVMVAIPGAAALYQIPWIATAAVMVVLFSWAFQAPSRVGHAWARLFEPRTVARERAATEERVAAEKVREEKAPGEEKAPRKGGVTEVDEAYAPPTETEGVAASVAAAGWDGGEGAAIPEARLAAWTGRARRLLLRASAPAVVFLGLAAWAEWPVVGRSALVGTSTLVGLCVLVAAIFDVVSELRFRAEWARARGGAEELESVLVGTRLFVAEAALAALSQAHVPAFARNLGVRTMLSFFAPFAPLEVLVPASFAAQARERLAAVIEPEPGSAVAGGGEVPSVEGSAERAPGTVSRKKKLRKRKRPARDEQESVAESDAEEPQAEKEEKAEEKEK